MFQRVFISSSLGHAEVVRALLCSEGFHPMELLIAGHAFQIGGEQGFFVEVPVGEVDEVRTFLSESGYEKYVL